MGAPSERFFSELIDLVVNSFGASGRAGMTTSCARAAGGHATALPSSAMNSRRFLSDLAPHSRSDHPATVGSLSHTQPATERMGKSLGRT